MSFGFARRSNWKDFHCHASTATSRRPRSDEAGSAAKPQPKMMVFAGQHLWADRVSTHCGLPASLKLIWNVRGDSSGHDRVELPWQHRIEPEQPVMHARNRAPE